METKAFGGAILVKGIAAPDAVKDVQNALKALGYAATPTGVFDEQLESVIRLFQAQHSDDSGLPLKK